MLSDERGVTTRQYHAYKIIAGCVCYVIVLEQYGNEVKLGLAGYGHKVTLHAVVCRCLCSLLGGLPTAAGCELNVDMSGHR